MHTEMSIRYGAFDPGADTGYAKYLGEHILEMGEVPWGDGGVPVMEWLEDHKDNFDVFIIENYRIRPVPMTKGHANTWSESHESQIIGMVRLWCWTNDIEFVTQEPSIKPVGYGFAGLKYVAGKKGTHMQDAIAHGCYWWMQVGRKRVP